MPGWTYLGISLTLLMAVLGPFVTIWSINTLFPSLSIPYDPWTWLAMVWINGLLVGRSVIRRA